MIDRKRTPKPGARWTGILAAVGVAAAAVLIPSPAAGAPVDDAALASALASAGTNGFLNEFRGDDQVFDGTRTVEVGSTGVTRLRNSQGGTLLVRFQTSSATNQVVVAGGSGTAAGSYGAILANGVSGTNKVRVDFPSGMNANLNGPALLGGWHTFAYSVNATPGGTTGRTTTSIDGSTSTQFPNFASWFNTTTQINALTYLTIGGAPSGLANSSNNAKFSGRIAYVAFIPQTYTQSQLASITSGVWDGTKAFSRGDATGSDFFRIPFLLNTAAGSLIAGTDANYGSTGDSAENIDAAVRRKANAASQGAASGWSTPVVPSALHMRDYADESGYKQSSASVIDGAIVQDTKNTGKIVLLIDMFAWNGGVFEFLNVNSAGQAAGGRNRTVAYGDGFATIGARKYLLLSSQNVKGNADGKTGNINLNTDRSRFDYVADVNWTPDASGRFPIYHLSGTPRAYTASGTAVDDSNLALGAVTTYTIDRELVLYQSGTALTVQQKSTAGGGPQVPMKAPYEDSVFQLYNTSYLLQVVSTDDGLTWQADQIVSDMVKRENSHYYTTGPGNATQLQTGAHAGRLIVPVYYQGTGATTTEVIYSDDAGQTWTHGAPIPTSLGLHEATTIELPDGSVQAFVRNTSGSGGLVVTATSTDGGATWRDVKSALGDNSQGVNSQVSSLRLAGTIVSPTTGTAQPAFVMVTATSRSRVHGVANVGLIHADGTYPDGAAKYRIEWINQHELTGASELFAYSSLAQLGNGRIGLLYETSPTSSWADGLQAMYYRELTQEELLD